MMYLDVVKLFVKVPTDAILSAVSDEGKSDIGWKFPIHQ